VARLCVGGNQVAEGQQARQASVQRSLHEDVPSLDYLHSLVLNTW
jgi:hypothetical protein